MCSFIKGKNRNVYYRFILNIFYYIRINILGNGTILSQKNELWKKIINNFKSQNVFGTSLKLQCQNHPEKFTFVSKESDFKNVEDGK